MSTPSPDRRTARSRALHRAVTRKIRQRPQEAWALAYRRVDRLAEDPHTRYYVREWRKWLERPLDDVCRLLAEDPSEYADAMRKMSPFVGLLTKAERDAIYRHYANAVKPPSLLR